VTVLDTSAAVDYLLEIGAAGDVDRLIAREGELVAPDVLVFEVLAALRRGALRGDLDEQRAWGAVDDLGDVPLQLMPSLPLRQRAWELRRNLTVADGLFVALAEALNEPLATKDRSLAAAAAVQTDLEVVVVGP
jgi:predicted nucleic acid-binding protein